MFQVWKLVFHAKQKDWALAKSRGKHGPVISNNYIIPPPSQNTTVFGTPLGLLAPQTCRGRRILGCLTILCCANEHSQICHSEVPYSPIDGVAAVLRARHGIASPSQIALARLSRAKRFEIVRASGIWSLKYDFSGLLVRATTTGELSKVRGKTFIDAILFAGTSRREEIFSKYGAKYSRISRKPPVRKAWNLTVVQGLGNDEERPAR